jgi:hypothetical protein
LNAETAHARKTHNHFLFLILQVHATQQHHFGHLNARTQMAMQLAESHNQRIVQLERSTQAATATAASNNGVSTSNPMDVLSFVCAILVSLPNFYKLEFQWRDFLTGEGRAAVFVRFAVSSLCIFLELLVLCFFFFAHTRFSKILSLPLLQHRLLSLASSCLSFMLEPCKFWAEQLTKITPVPTRVIVASFRVL